MRWTRRIARQAARHGLGLGLAAMFTLTAAASVMPNSALPAPARRFVEHYCASAGSEELNSQWKRVAYSLILAVKGNEGRKPVCPAAAPVMLTTSS